MKLLIAVFFVALIALTGATQTASAQSPYSYPWCARYYTKSTPTSCYYASRQQCAATASGIGGYCFQNPGYRGPAARYDYRHHYAYRS
jgi:hypothetical protein